jgi:cell division protein ZapA
MKQVETTILGQSYMLACPPDGEHLLIEAVALVDSEMRAIRDAGKVKARERIAVLTALNLAYQRAEQAHAPQPSSSDAIDTSPASAPAEPDALAIEQLIHRIDAALSADGLSP